METIVQKLEAMNSFVKVVALGSYSEAARRLGMTRSAVSKAVAELETGLGARLLDRTTRRVSPTEAGSAYYQRCLAILAQVEDTEAEIARLHDEPRGLLRVNGPMSFGVLYLGEAVAEFMAAYPDLRVELDLTDRFIDPLEEGVDVTIRIRNLSDSTLIARKVACAQAVLAASPDYLAERGAPSEPEDLVNHRCLDYGCRQAAPRWRLARAGRQIVVPVTACLHCNNGEVLRAGALRGLGVVLLPTFIIGADLRAGRLVEVLPEYAPPEIGVYALYAPNRFVAVKVRAFIDFLVAKFASASELSGRPPNKQATP
jgi:DNA-binding transcriptional LysR family regulator